MELNQLVTLDAHEEGSHCRLLQADGSLSDAFVVVQGPDSSAFRMARRSQRTKLLGLKAKGVDLDSHDLFPLDVDFACAIVTDWGNITIDGELVEFTDEGIKNLLSKSPTNVDRILDYCGERVNFMKG